MSTLHQPLANRTANEEPASGSSRAADHIRPKRDWTCDPNSQGVLVRAKTPTRWACTSLEMAARPSTPRCGGHTREPLLGGRGVAAPFYPSPRITGVLADIRGP